MITGIVIMITAGSVAYVSCFAPKILTNHIPHLLLPKHLADRFQNWAERQ